MKKRRPKVSTAWQNKRGGVVRRLTTTTAKASREFSGAKVDVTGFRINASKMRLASPEASAAIDKFMALQCTPKKRRRR